MGFVPSPNLAPRLELTQAYRARIQQQLPAWRKAWDADAALREQFSSFSTYAEHQKARLWERINAEIEATFVHRQAHVYTGTR